jgi:uncharacterized protein
MKRLLNSSLKRPKRLSATKENCPIRQCCVCKKVLPKDKLMRLIKQQTEKAFYDHYYRTSGRGYYICPTTDCLERTTKAKNFRFRFLKVDKEVFKEEIKSKIFYEIVKEINLCCKMGYIQKSVEKTIEPEDYLIAGNDKTAESQRLVERARMLGLKIFDLKGNNGGPFIETAIVKGTWPMQKKMLKNLERLQSLSFRGASL